MFKDQCISITDLRTKTKDCFNSLKGKPKYIFANNKLVGVLVDPDEFEQEKIGVLYAVTDEKVRAKVVNELESVSKSDLIDY